MDAGGGLHELVLRWLSTAPMASPQLSHRGPPRELLQSHPPHCLQSQLTSTLPFNTEKAEKVQRRQVICSWTLRSLSKHLESWKCNFDFILKGLQFHFDITIISLVSRNWIFNYILDKLLLMNFASMSMFLAPLQKFIANVCLILGSLYILAWDCQVCIMVFSYNFWIL